MEARWLDPLTLHRAIVLPGVGFAAIGPVRVVEWQTPPT
jgi:hypothetical protein